MNDLKYKVGPTMKEIWSENPALIEEEIKALIEEKTLVSLYQPGHPPIKSLVREVVNSAGGKRLILIKKEQLRAQKESCLALYHVPKSPMRAFKSDPISESIDQLEILFPSEIVQIQRRRHPRFVTSSNSVVIFARKGSQTLHRGIIKDVCMEGAKLLGEFPGHIHAGDRLGPITMTLRLNYSNYEENFTIHEAKICRVIDLEKNNKEFGIHFELNGKEYEPLERFITMRTLEGNCRRPR
jgi:hypothetical protein